MQFQKSFGICTSAGLEQQGSSTNGHGESFEKTARTPTNV